jgi:hypothetical protein
MREIKGQFTNHLNVNYSLNMMIMMIRIKIHFKRLKLKQFTYFRMGFVVKAHV